MAVPMVTVAFGRTVNEVVAAFPKLSVTVTACAPVMPDGTVIVNAQVPCSVTRAVVGCMAAAEVIPNLTDDAVNWAVGPNPASVAIIVVPT